MARANQLERTSSCTQLELVASSLIHCSIDFRVFWVLLRRHFKLRIMSKKLEFTTFTTWNHDGVTEMKSYIKLRAESVTHRPAAPRANRNALLQICTLLRQRNHDSLLLMFLQLPFSKTIDLLKRKKIYLKERFLINCG